MQTSASVLDELVRRIVREVNPRRIILFGSAARGEAGAQSDIDLLLVMPDGVHRRKTAQRLYGRLGGDRPPVDIVVVTESDLVRHADTPGYIYRSALRDGRELYAA